MTGTGVELVAFLRARLDEDGDETQPWALHQSGCMLLLAADPVNAVCDCPGPDRWFREVEAKRRIIAEHLHFGPDTWNPRFCIRCGPINHGEYCLTVRYLTLPAADHPDYREEWKP